jgi:hypothetical protein
MSEIDPTATAPPHWCDRDCIECGLHVRSDQRVRLHAGWLCRACLETDAYLRGRQDGAEGRCA